MNTHNYEELAALHTIAMALAQPWDLRDQLEQVLNEMNARLGMQRGMISLLDRDSGESWLEVAHGVIWRAWKFPTEWGKALPARLPRPVVQWPSQISARNCFSLIAQGPDAR